MEFGVFDHLDRDDQAPGDYYRSRLEIVEAYDRLGFYAYHVAEHHATLGRPTTAMRTAEGGPCGRPPGNLQDFRLLRVAFGARSPHIGAVV